MPPPISPSVFGSSPESHQMIIGQTLLKGATVYSPWFPSQADAVTFALEVIGLSTNGVVTVTIQHRNTDTVESSATTEASQISLNAVGILSGRYTGIKELWRMKFDCTGSITLDWVHFRMLTPAWESTAGRFTRSAAGLSWPQSKTIALGTTLFKGLTVYSQWFPRLANSATFLAQTIARSGATCTITIQSKLASDSETGNITNMGSTISCSAVGTASAHNADLKEMVRYKYVITGTNAYDWIHFMMLEPQWEFN